MSFSQQLLSRDGPLAHVWLAANLEKKLTKNQLLSTNISKTTLAISDSNRSLQVEPLALRWTGTLLYGIVRIYSRKAKYLLDDVSDALFRLKTCFKSNSNSVILPAEATVIPSVKQVILNDTVTANDLLYQAPLSFDDDNTNEQVKNYGSENMNEDSLVVDASTGSIELGRGNEFMDDLDHHHNNSMNNNDLDLELDFDLGEDEENVSHRVSDISVVKKKTN
ncbi:hypothetical protein PACTADRAFT_31802 [Pachysolen tannophilus NRRL Y-2460]|uniref:Rad21/Rec8-like protein N-terminal domain-containing protein n=1 Tax=Pachysolen tannophilus NRRL Y-2460 TaxID=669874 RepID=A0A1E4U3D1_PACTA|nr:hypothetical protein PACTADRAFT_31802 [Pachysolen tannophilus NRRL Y-2460]